jgi:DNA-binding winged helix-turn-helix (wHTH) protein/Tfp pilus assembly protein PilF
MMGDQFRIEDWLVEVRLGRVSRNGLTVHLEPQVMKVLAYLAARPHEVISKDELLTELWNGNCASDASLARCISRIRVVLGDDARKAHIVETIPKVGYRLVGRVRRPANRNTRIAISRWLGAAAAAVVLGVAISAGISGPSEMRLESVYDAAAVDAYRKGLELYNKYTYPFNQNSIAHFEKALAIEPDFGLAYAGLADALVQEAHYWKGDRKADALKFAGQAVALEPQRVESHRALGKALAINGEDVAALHAYHKALELDPADWVSALQSANLRFQRLEFEQAEALYLQTLEHAPNLDVAMSNLGYLYLKSGNVEAARRWFDRALERFPLQQQAGGRLAMLELFTGETGKALARCERLVESYPAHYSCLQLLAVGSLIEGDFGKARQGFDAVLASYPEDRYARLGNAKVLIAEGRHREAEELIESVIAETSDKLAESDAESYDYWLMAGCHTLLGDDALAYQWFDKAAQAGRRFSLWDANDPLFASLHGDRRFDGYIAATAVVSPR